MYYLILTENDVQSPTGPCGGRLCLPSDILLFYFLYHLYFPAFCEN